jgi:glutamate---cysteine ligase / carboxylate-amine ligase
VIEQRFGESPPWSLGVEEELFVLDAETLEPALWPPELFDGNRLKAELFATVVELTTGICDTAEEAADELEELRAEARRRAVGSRLVVAAAGTWPTAVSEQQPITDDPGYRAFVERTGSPARRQYCSGLHLHIGVPSAEACMAALEAVLPWLPVLLAVSANSPYVAGRETGLASTRAEILALLPRAGAPPVFSSYAQWEGYAERLVDFGLADRWTRIWWDVRPHPDYGTLEIRMPDQPTRLEATVAFAALAQALVASAEQLIPTTHPRTGSPPPADRGIYAENRWAAARFGRDAQLLHPDGSRLVSAPDLLAELLERVAPTARRLGCEGLLAPLNTLAQAEEQLAVGREQGLSALGKRLVALT